MNPPCRAVKVALSNTTNSASYQYSMYMNLLQNCIDSRAVTQGLLLHNHLLTNGFDSNLHLNTKLIIFYAKVGRVFYARKLFDRMSVRSVVSWTAMISGYTQNGCYYNALDVFVAMRRAGVRANQFGFGSALRSCTGLRSSEIGIQIQACVQKSRFVENLHVQSALIDFHSKCGRMSDACYLFDMTSERDLVSWNVIIGGFSLRGYFDDSFRVFCSMMTEGKRPDCFTFGSLLRAVAENSSLLKLTQVHGLIILLGLESNSALKGSLINAYAKCGSIRSSDKIYRAMSKKDIISCTSLILGYARNRMHNKEALELFREMTRMHKVIDTVALCAMLSICANTASLSLGTQIHALAFKHQPRYDVAMGNSLVDMYAKTGEIEEAQRAFDEMEERNIISWTALIAGYGKHGYGNKAIELFRKMESKGLKPNDITFLTLLFACSHTGLTHEGWDCFKDMVGKYNIFPREEHLSCLVDIFARGGRLEEAYQLICDMNITNNASVWGSVLGACSVHGNTSLGELAAKHLICIEPENPVNYVLLSSLYCGVGQWDNAGKAMSLIDVKSLRKEKGCSILQSTVN